jgi:hypothetical protein
LQHCGQAFDTNALQTSGASHSRVAFGITSRSGTSSRKAHANPNFYRQLNVTKKISITFIALLAMQSIVFSQTAATASASPGASPAEQAEVSPVVVQSEELDVSREAIVPSLGATRYTIGPDRLDSQAQGENAPFNQTILRFPGVAQDSFGQVHVRGEHANLQYRIDDVLLPESIPGFGQELETRFADSVSLITGALPAQFGFRTTGVIDIHTKNGAVFQQGETSLYGGSFDTIKESLEYGGVLGKLSVFATESYLHNGIGIENPTPSSDPIHDDTDQYKLFGYLSYIFDPTSRLTLLISGNHSDFQIPNTLGLPPVYTVGTRSTFNSAKLDENQSEDSTYEILTYQKRFGDFSFQASVFSRYSAVLFRPDDVGDLIFNGVASRVDRSILSNGIELDSSYKLSDQHTFRAGFLSWKGTERSTHLPWSFRSMPMVIRPARFRCASSIITTNTDPFTVCICRMNGSPSNSSRSISAAGSTS